MISNTNRTFGQTTHLNESSLQLMGTLFGIINGSSRFIWGYLMDIFGFKCLMIIISFMELTVSLTIFYVASKMQNIIIYIIIIFRIIIIII